MQSKDLPQPFSTPLYDVILAGYWMVYVADAMNGRSEFFRTLLESSPRAALRDSFVQISDFSAVNPSIGQVLSFN